MHVVLPMYLNCLWHACTVIVMTKHFSFKKQGLCELKFKVTSYGMHVLYCKASHDHASISLSRGNGRLILCHVNGAVIGKVSA